MSGLLKLIFFKKKGFLEGFKVIKDYVIFEGGWEGVGEIRELILISRRPLETGLQIKKKEDEWNKFY